MDLLSKILLSWLVVYLLRKSLETKQRLPEWDALLAKFGYASMIYFGVSFIPGLGILKSLYEPLSYGVYLLTLWFLKDYRPARTFGLAFVPLAAIFVFRKIVEFVLPGLSDSVDTPLETLQAFSTLWLLGFGIYAYIQNNKELKQRQKDEEQLRISEARKAELEHLVAERTTELTQQKERLEKTLDELRAAQSQLVHAEKMASLGELTAGIAHEIQNPLNFVNNFSELSVELAAELKVEIEKLDIPEADKSYIGEILGDLSQNQEKINHHGKRAASIVTGMLQHARTNADAKKEATDLNALADEYMRLAYHGLRAKDKSFNAKMVTDFDQTIGSVAVVRQDLGRVFLNLINNAFYAVAQKRKDMPAGENYEPTVTLISRRDTKNDALEFRIRDNGTGIPESLKAKIFQPFFTTKPTGQGTGLGLSLAYDIVSKGHGGSMEVKSREGDGTEFIIRLPS